MFAPKRAGKFSRREEDWLSAASTLADDPELSTLKLFQSGYSRAKI